MLNSIPLKVIILITMIISIVVKYLDAIKSIIIYISISTPQVPPQHLIIIFDLLHTIDELTSISRLPVRAVNKY